MRRSTVSFAVWSENSLVSASRRSSSISSSSSSSKLSSISAWMRSWIDVVIGGSGCGPVGSRDVNANIGSEIGACHFAESRRPEFGSGLPLPVEATACAAATPPHRRYSEQVREHYVEACRQADCDRQRQHPCHQEISDGCHLQAGTV